MKPTIHELKTLPEYFEQVFMGTKTFEIRLNDRDFKVNDILILKEYNHETGKYTGRQLARTVIYILDGGKYGLREDYCVMSIQ